MATKKDTDLDIQRMADLRRIAKAKERHNIAILKTAKRTEELSAQRVKLARWQVSLATITFLVVMFHLVYNILY